MRKYPRMTWGEWNMLSRDERHAYSQLAKAEGDMLRAERERNRNKPRDLSYYRPQEHRWSIDYSIKSRTGTYSISGKSDMGKVVYANQRTGVTNPKWREQIKAFASAGTPYSRQDGLVRDAPGGIYAEYLSGTDLRIVRISGDLARQTLPSLSASEAAAEQTARLQFYKKLKRTQHEFGGGVFLGEIRESARLIRKPYVEIPRLINRYVRDAKNIIKRPKKSLTWTQREKKLANAWLTTTFGLLPLVSDIQDAAGALASLLNQERQQRVRGVGIDEKQVGTVIPVSCYNPGGGFYVCSRDAREEKAQVLVRYTGGVHVRAVGPDLSSVPDLSRRFGVGISDFVPTLYELLPWSFLWDYVTTVGDVLNAWAVSYSSVKWQSKTVRVTRETKYSGTLNFAESKKRTPGLKVMQGYLGSCTAYKSTMSRSDPGTVPLPQLEFRTNLSPIKVMNVLALRANLTAAVKGLLGK